MKLESLDIQDVKIIQPDIYQDSRGLFFESFQEERFKDQGLPIYFFQDNQSVSSKGVLRGLHFQNPPFAQGKLVRVAKGAVLDVAVDLRKESPTYGKWVSQLLSGDNKLMMWIPPGFAHGFLSLEEENIFLYKCTTPYHKDSECTIRWDDPDLAIDWGTSQPLLSEKDSKGIEFNRLKSLF